MDQIIVLFPAMWGSTDRESGKTQSKQYSLAVTQIWESVADHPEWIFIVSGGNASRGGVIACKTPAMMKALLRGLPVGSSLDWHPRTPSELDVLVDHLDEMLTICARARVVFTIHH